MSLALRQAMSAGLPVIGCQGTAAEDRVTGETGLLVPPRDTDDLAEAILWCYRNGRRSDRLDEPAEPEWNKSSR